MSRDGLTGRRRPAEAIIKLALMTCGLISIATTVGIIGSLLFEAVAFFKQISLGEFLGTSRWAPTFSPPGFGVWPLLSATFSISAIGMLVSLPLGLGAAVYLSEYARPSVRKVVKPTLEILAGIPTVVFGYFALTFVTPRLLRPFVPGMQSQIFNALSAGLVVGVAILPLIASISEDAMRAVPRSLREAAFGLGATRLRVAARVVVPAALSGIAAASILGLSRAIGETMIVAIASGQIANLSLDPREPMQTMTSYIVQVSLGDTPVGSVAYRTIFALGATLFAITLALNSLSIMAARRFRQRYG